MKSELIRQGSRDLLNFDRIRKARLFHMPFPWSFIELAFFNTNSLRELVGSFPETGFDWFQYDDGYKSHLMQRRILIPRGLGVSIARESNLSPSWQKLASELCSVQYRRAISSLIGIDIELCPMEATFRRYSKNCWLAPHIDLPDKIVTQILYFNDHWDCSWGGCLRILRSRNLDDVHCELPPTAGTSTILVRVDHGWHAVTPVALRDAQARKSLQISFYRKNVKVPG